MFSHIPRIHLATVPTPLDEAPRLAKEIGLSHLFIKRDDLTGFAGGGTKVRKLEYDFADILAKKCDVVVSAGGVQSNLVRLAAAASARFGLKMKGVLGGPEFQSYDGNLLLNSLFGAEIRFLPNDDANDHLTSAAMEWAEELKQSGSRPYVLPIGGSTPLGSLGCISVIEEIAAQLKTQGKVQIVLPVGSCGTFAGMMLGARMILPDARIIGISISRSAAAIRKRTSELSAECAALLQLDYPLNENDIECYDHYHQEYGTPTPEGQHAVIRSARLEGLLLDPVYTGKAMSGLFDLAAKGVLDKNIPTVFLHTGGLPILFSFESSFRSSANVTIKKESL